MRLSHLLSEILCAALLATAASAQTVIPYGGPTDDFEVGRVAAKGIWSGSDLEQRFALYYPNCQIFKISEVQHRGRGRTHGLVITPMTFVSYFQSDKCPPKFAAVIK